MKARKSYKDQDKFRKYRNRYKKRYASRRNFSDGKYKHLTTREMEIVLAHEITDTEIAKMLNRSIVAVQMKRHKLKKEIEGR